LGAFALRKRRNVANGVASIISSVTSRFARRRAAAGSGAGDCVFQRRRRVIEERPRARDRPLTHDASAAGPAAHDLDY